MKWKAIVEDYFTFNKVQRRSIILTLSLIIACLIVRFSYRYFAATEVVPVDTAFLQAATRLTQPDTTKTTYSSYYSNRYSKEEEEATYREPFEKYKAGPNKRADLFLFNPNTLNKEGWKRLGLQDKTIATIQNYLSKGGRFRQPDDIKRIYGLHPDEAERLLPYIKIPSPTVDAIAENRIIQNESTAPTYKSYVPKTVDINTADTAAFIALPGIGSKLANRIVGFRDKLGGFYSIEQIAETYGLPDSTFQKIKPRLLVNPFSIKKLNINTADANALKANPYIRWNVANAIFQYRQQHGNYTSLNDLKNIALIDEQLFGKLQPYLTIE